MRTQSEPPTRHLQTAHPVVVYDLSAVPALVGPHLTAYPAAPRHTVVATLPSSFLVDTTALRATPLSETSTKGDADIAQELQLELKRVGCYLGEIDGIWGPGSRRAMAAFTERVNAVLPVERPDTILLRLVTAHSGTVCGQQCPRDQALTRDGRCVPNAILAQSLRRGRSIAARTEAATAAGTLRGGNTQTAVAVDNQSPAYQPTSSTTRVEPVATLARPGQGRNSRATANANASASARPAIDVSVQQPFAGRMAIGGPNAGLPDTSRRNASIELSPLRPDRPSREARRAAAPRQQANPRRASYASTSRSTRWTATFFGSNP